MPDDIQPIPPSVTPWVQVLVAEKALLDYIRMAREQAAGIVARDEEEQHRIAVSVFEAAGAVIKLAPDLVGPAKAAIMMRKVFDEIKYLCQNDTSSNPTVRAIYTALTLVEEDIVCG